MLINRTHDIVMKVARNDVVNLIRSIPVARPRATNGRKESRPLIDSMPASVFGR